MQFQFPFWILAFCFWLFSLDYLLFLLVFSVFVSFVLSWVLFVIVSCPYPDSLTPTTWKQLATFTSQVSGSVSPYLAARLVRLLKFTSSYRAPVFLLNQPSGAAASTLGLRGHHSCPHCVVCPAPLFGLIHSSLYLLFQVTVLSIKLQLSAHLHLGPISCRSLTLQSATPIQRERSGGRYKHDRK